MASPSAYIHSVEEKNILLNFLPFLFYNRDRETKYTYYIHKHRQFTYLLCMCMYRAKIVFASHSTVWFLIYFMYLLYLLYTPYVEDYNRLKEFTKIKVNSPIKKIFVLKDRTFKFIFNCMDPLIILNYGL